MADPTKVAWVTGSSTGIGRAAALKLVERGYNVVAHYASSEEKARKVVGRIESLGGDALVVRADVSEAGDVRRMVREIEDRYERLGPGGRPFRILPADF